ncbi:MAG: HepT-like ribonuclease domain-containing protein [Pyrinomonadaceae bacterium]
MRNEDLYLVDICDACLAISDFVAGISRELFLETDLVQSAVIHKFIVIGEAASKLNSTIREEHPEVDWKTLVAFRNILVHVYFDTVLDKVWEATLDVDALREHVSAIRRYRKAEENR